MSSHYRPTSKPTPQRVSMPNPRVLGAVPLKRFIAQNWKRKPLLIRNAFRFGAQAQDLLPCSIEELLALAVQPDAQARLVNRSTTGASRWKVKSSPLTRLPSRKKPGWTVLVQGVDRHLGGVRALLDEFRFIGDVQIDDVMISYASDGGGIGAHVDSYDVFLLQAQGRRRWRVAKPLPAARLIPDQPLKLLAEFEPELDYILDPGDMLYLPPGWGHEGTALGECTTYSIGFRAPERSEVVNAWHEELAERSLELSGAPGKAPQHLRSVVAPETFEAPARIPAEMGRQIQAWLNKPLFSAQALIHEQACFIGRYLTEPQASVVFPAPKPVLVESRWRRQVANRGLRLALASRMLYDEHAVYMNGESMVCSGLERRFLQELANQRGLAGSQCAELLRRDLSALVDLLLTWTEDGWLLIGSDD